MAKEKVYMINEQGDLGGLFEEIPEDKIDNVRNSKEQDKDN